MATKAAPQAFYKTNVTRSSGLETWDNWDRYALDQGKVLGNALEAVTHKPFVESIKNSAAGAGPTGIHGCEGWYYPFVDSGDRDSLHLAAISYDDAKDKDWRERVFIFDSAIKRAKRGEAVMIRVAQIGGETLRFRKLFGIAILAPDGEPHYVALREPEELVKPVQVEENGILTVTSKEGAEIIRMEVRPGYVMRVEGPLRR